MASSTPLWTPSHDRIEDAAITAFMARASAISGQALGSYADLHRWSVEDRGAFWSLIWDFCGVIGDKGGRLLVDGDRMPGASFFRTQR